MWWRGYSRAALRRLIHDRRGVTAIEFGIVGFIFVVLLLGAVDLGRFQFTQQSLRDAAGEAARAALINLNLALAANPTGTPACPTGATLKNAVTTPTNLTPFLTPASLSIASSCTTDGNGVRIVTVTASYPFQFVAPLLPAGALTLNNAAALTY